MSTLKIEERLTVSAPPERVWEFLLDPARVAACLPGAQLDGLEGERTFLGTMKVKVGPVLMEFKGKATMSEVDEAARRVMLTGTGNDKSGSGTARMSMNSRVIATPSGGSEIVVMADVDLAGKLVRFGRGMTESISKQIFKQFAERVRAELASADASASELPAATVEPPTGAAAAASEAPPKEEPPPAAALEEPAMNAEPEPSTTSEEPTATATARTDEPTATAPRKETPTATARTDEPTALASRKDNAPLAVGSLFFTALWEWIKSLFRRLVGRRS